MSEAKCTLAMFQLSPPAATAMHDSASLVLDTHRALEAYLAIHDDIFAPGLWRTVRRSVPIPGLFEPVPFSMHASCLKRLRENLATIQISAGRDLLSESDDQQEKFLRATRDYCQTLGDSIGRLSRICERLAAKADGSSTMPLAAYDKEVDDYRQSTLNYELAGEVLNQLVLGGPSPP